MTVYYLGQEVILYAFQQSPGSPTALCAVFPAEIRVVKVAQEDKSQWEWCLLSWSQQAAPVGWLDQGLQQTPPTRVLFDASVPASCPQDFDLPMALLQRQIFTLYPLM